MEIKQKMLIYSWRTWVGLYKGLLMNQILFSMIVFAMGMLVGCVPRLLEPDAQNITLIFGQKTQISERCKFLGKISGKDVHGRLLHFTWGLEKNLKKDDINFLKNEGRKLNANVVVFEKHQTLIKRFYTSLSRHTDVSDHAIEGSAYRCPIQMISSLKLFNNLKDSVYEKPILIKGN